MSNLAKVPSVKVHEFGVQLVRQASNGGTFCALFDDWLRSNYRYRSEDKEIVRTPEFMANDYATLGYMEGDCDDVATFVCSVCHHVGIPSRLASISIDPTLELKHVFAECQTANGWCIIDPTVEKGTTYAVYSVFYQPVSG